MKLLKSNKLMFGFTCVLLLFQTTPSLASFTSSSPSRIEQIGALSLANLPNNEQKFLEAPNKDNGDLFGYSVAVDGDTAVIGAPYEDSDATGVNGDQDNDNMSDTGAVYVYTRSGTQWTLQAYLKASNTNMDDYFGYSVDIYGDTIVVGAINEDSNATGVNGNQTDNSGENAGAAYVFTRNNGVWTQQAYLKATPGYVYRDAYFGNSVSIYEDTIAVGAYREWHPDDILPPPNAGAVYVFTRSGGSWSYQQRVIGLNTGKYDEFGYSVSVYQDTLAVGARHEYSNATGINGDGTNNSAPRSGAAYIFTRGAGVWSQQAYIKASNSEAYDTFGSAVDLFGDTLVVGAPDEESALTGVNPAQTNNEASLAGAAYIFNRSGSTWTQQAYLKASNTASGNHFGWSVTISDNAVVVGALKESSSGIGLNGTQSDNVNSARLYSGAAYLFSYDGINWSQQIYIKASNPDYQNRFGISASMSHDTLVIGANVGASGLSTPGAGGAYIFAYTKPPTFVDVPSTYWAFDFIEQLYNAGITGGCSTSPLNYCPTVPVTRAQMAVFLLKGIHGSSYAPPAVGSDTGFTDVALDYWAAAWIKQLAAEGITGGCGVGSYCPENTVTRAQMAVFLLKATHGSSYAPPAATGIFSDVATDYWAAAWVEQLAAEGITSGCATGTYCPENPVTRDQMAVFLVKAFNLP